MKALTKTQTRKPSFKTSRKSTYETNRQARLETLRRKEIRKFKYSQK